MLTLFEWIGDEGLSLRGAVHRLIARGIRSPQGRAWRPTTLYRLLTNPAYKGLAVYNRRRHLPVEGRRSPRVAVKPRNEWVEITVPAFVSPALWDRVQARLVQRRAGRPAKRVYLLSGRLRCGVCGRRLYGGQARNWPYYRCASIDWVAAGLAGRCGLKAQHAEVDLPRFRGHCSPYTPPGPQESNSLAFGRRCEDAGVRPSMGSVGDAYDNALCESFFATLECELLDRRRFATQGAARRLRLHRGLV
jgi:Recombinase/Recombinase zinc beta ribbon domain